MKRILNIFKMHEILIEFYSVILAYNEVLRMINLETQTLAETF